MAILGDSMEEHGLVIDWTHVCDDILSLAQLKYSPLKPPSFPTPLFTITAKQPLKHTQFRLYNDNYFCIVCSSPPYKYQHHYHINHNSPPPPHYSSCCTNCRVRHGEAERAAPPGELSDGNREWEAAQESRTTQPGAAGPAFSAEAEASRSKCSASQHQLYFWFCSQQVKQTPPVSITSFRTLEFLVNVLVIIF